MKDVRSADNRRKTMKAGIDLYEPYKWVSNVSDNESSDSSQAVDDREDRNNVKWSTLYAYIKIQNSISN